MTGWLYIQIYHLLVKRAIQRNTKIYTTKPLIITFTIHFEIIQSVIWQLHLKKCTRLNLFCSIGNNGSRIQHNRWEINDRGSSLPEDFNRNVQKIRRKVICLSNSRKPKQYDSKSEKTEQDDI